MDAQGRRNPFKKALRKIFGEGEDFNMGKKHVKKMRAIGMGSFHRHGKGLSLLFLLCSSILISSLPVWGGQYFVDAAAAEEGDGGSDHPFKTIQQGVDRAQAGDTVIVRKGIYLEQIMVNHGGTAEKPLVIKADPIGSVVVDGADPLKGFEEDTAYQTTDKTKVWVYSAYRSPYVPMGNDFNLRTDWTKEGEVGKQQVELLSRNDMIWLDGRFLDEVDTPDQLRFGTFWVDRQKGALYVPLIATDRPEDHLIEATQRGTLFDCGSQSSFVHLRGFHFTRGGFNGKAVAKIGSYSTQGWVAEDNIADWGNFSGFQFYGRNNQILRNVAADNGCEGMQGIIHDTVLDGNSSLRNNWKGIRDTYESGGGKFTESENVTVRNHLAAYNRGPGLWFDIFNKNITVENSRFHDNKYAGIFIEIELGPTEIRGNTCWANQGGGIVIGESSNVVIENNILADNWYGIDLRNLQGRHDLLRNSDGTSTEMKWQTSNITIRGNVLLKNTRAGIGNTCCYLDPVAERISSDNNIFWDNNILWWQAPDPKGPNANVPKPAGLEATIGGFWVINNIYLKDKFGGLEQHSTCKDPGFVNSDMYQFPAPPQ